MSDSTVTGGTVLEPADAFLEALQRDAVFHRCMADVLAEEWRDLGELEQAVDALCAIDRFDGDSDAKRAEIVARREILRPKVERLRRETVLLQERLLAYTTFLLAQPTIH